MVGAQIVPLWLFSCPAETHYLHFDWLFTFTGDPWIFSTSMSFRGYLSSLFSRNKATETDNDAPQLQYNLGMRLLHDGTKPRTGQSLVEGGEESQPCLEPVKYARTCPRSRLRDKLTHIWQLVSLPCMAWRATLSPHGYMMNHAWCGLKPYFLLHCQWVVSCPTVMMPRYMGAEALSISWTMLQICCPEFRQQELLRR